MAVLVVSGSGRGVGKTAVGCSLMTALPEFLWVGVKVSPYEHGVADLVREGADRGSEKDTERYLAAGAQKALLVDGQPDCLCGVRTGTGESLLVETTRVSLGVVAGEREAAVRLAVVGGCAEDWKDSLWESVGETDAVVLTGGFPVEQLPGELRWKRLFWLARGAWSSRELVGFVRQRFERIDRLTF